MLQIYAEVHSDAWEGERGSEREGFRGGAEQVVGKG